MNEVARERPHGAGDNGAQVDRRRSADAVARRAVPRNASVWLGYGPSRSPGAGLQPGVGGDPRVEGHRLLRSILLVVEDLGRAAEGDEDLANTRLLLGAAHEQL